MPAFDRSRKRIHQSKKAIIRLSLCFVMGFLTGFAPSKTIYQPVHSLPAPIAVVALRKSPGSSNSARLLIHEQSDPVILDDGVDGAGHELEVNPRRQLIVITTTSSGEKLKMAQLTRLSHTLAMVRPPLLWVVVEAHAEAAKTADMLRRTGIMYRHLTFKDNFTDFEAEAHHQHNLALNHVEHHRLTGIVHFAAASNVYDLRFFEQIRSIETFGTWPIAKMSANRKTVVVEGLICSSSKLVGWFSKNFADSTVRTMKYGDPAGRIDGRSLPSRQLPTINFSAFAFNSSILWDPERWGRATSLPDTSQDSIKFVQEAVLQEGAKLKCIPSNHPQIMIWQTSTRRTVPSPNANHNHNSIAM